MILLLPKLNLQDCNLIFDTQNSVSCKQPIFPRLHLVPGTQMYAPLLKKNSIFIKLEENKLIKYILLSKSVEAYFQNFDDYFDELTFFNHNPHQNLIIR